MGPTWSSISHLTDEETEVQKGSVIFPGSQSTLSHGGNYDLGPALPPWLPNGWVLKAQNCFQTTPGLLYAWLPTQGLLKECDNDPGAGCVPVLTFQVSRAPCVTMAQSDGQVKKVSLWRVFAKSIFWSDNSLTPSLLFSADTKPRLQLYHLLVICVAWKELRVRSRKKVGVLLGFPAGQHTGLLLGLFFLDYHITMITATSFFHPGSDTTLLSSTKYVNMQFFLSIAWVLWDICCCCCF